MKKNNRRGFALATASKNFRRLPQMTGKIAWRVKTFVLRLAGSFDIRPGKAPSLTIWGSYPRFFAM
jgi:hypothetical protein